MAAIVVVANLFAKHQVTPVDPSGRILMVKSTVSCGLLVLFAILISSGLTQAQDPNAPTPKNALKNPGFEDVKDGQPVGWSKQGWSGKASEQAISDGGRSGKRCVMIASTEGGDIAWATSVTVKPLSKYRISAWIKTRDVKPHPSRKGLGAMLNIHGGGAERRTRGILGTNDWTRVEMTFETEYGEREIQLNCLFGAWGLTTGTAWYDDLSVELLSTRTLKPKITIDASKTGQPISKYIYGQFIEHLGRCIYGGIWAEMLEDRKFYYAVTDEFKPYRRPRSENVKFPVVSGSPWKVIGPAGTVAMSKKDPFVGEQTPEIALGGGSARGIEQGDLGVVKGKGYVGRIYLSGAQAGPVEVSLIWGKGAKDRHVVNIDKLTDKFARLPLKFTSGADTDTAVLRIVASGKGKLRIGTVSLMPADNVQGWRPDTLKLMKDLNSPVYRWPGGNFVSAYNWRDGIGDVDKRPPRKNPAWTGVEHNDVGIHEFMTLCKLLNTEPFIAVNTGLGTVEEIAEEVEYCNGSPESKQGKLRAANGHREPFGVKWWAVGNEMYGGWQKGHMPLAKYVEKHNRSAKAMWAMDPKAKLIAVGHVGDWSKTMLTVCANHMTLLSEHIYCQTRKSLPAHVAQMTRSIRRVGDAHRQYRKDLPALKGKDIRIAMDEWNYWYGPHVYGELGTRYFLRDALGCAAGLHEFYRYSDVYFMANYAQTVNVIGCIKTSKTQAQMAATGVVLELYRKRYGQIPVICDGDASPLDVAGAWTADRKAFTLAIVNPTLTKQTLDLTIKGVKLASEGRKWTISGDDQMLYNDPGKPRAVDIVESAAKRLSGKYVAEPMSITLYRFDAKKAD